MEFITKYSPSVLEGSKQAFTKPSLTEPDNAMSIPEIIARFTRGQGLQVPTHPWTSGTATEGDFIPHDDWEGIIPGVTPQEPQAPQAPQEPQAPQDSKDPEEPKQ